jgi:4-hydroxybenzoyl-CoA thioesterase/acyl-CoA thioester hydrolase
LSQSFQVNRRVEFRDTDMAGIVHFSVFFTYMEQAEHEFLRSLGLGVIAKVEGQEISWPRVSATCDYRRAIKFEQLIDITLRVSRIGEKSVSYDFRFEHSGQLVAEGRITAVCCLFQHGFPPQSVPIPRLLREKLTPYLIDSASG